MRNAEMVLGVLRDRGNQPRYHAVVIGEPDDRKRSCPDRAGGRWKMTHRHLANGLPVLSRHVPPRGGTTRQPNRWSRERSGIYWHRERRPDSGAADF
jgi:hypothetical protein